MFFSLIGTIFLLGFRHGFDLDHIAAISDIVSQTKNKRRAILNGFFYIFGHAITVVLIGVFAIMLGANLPSWLDRLMGPIVALTLIFLGIWIIFSILVRNKEFKFISRWMLVFKLFIHVYNHLFGNHHKHPIEYPKSFGKKASYILGTIHAVGAETPTQILLFATAAGVGGFGGSLLLLIFIIGLLTSNLIVLLLSILGFIHAEKSRGIYAFLALFVGGISLLVGFMILVGKI